jgi:hypothetical protein
MAIGLAVRPRTVLVEGSTDADVFRLAAKLEMSATGSRLIGDDFVVLAAGERDRGGVSGVIREFVSLRGMARTCLLPNGRPRYRFVALFDNDDAGRKAITLARHIDSSIMEFKDLFLLKPVMPIPGNLDPGHVRHTFERENADYKGLDWELEDLLPEGFVNAFLSEFPDAVRRSSLINGKMHRDYTSDGKARLHWYVKQNAIQADMSEVIDVLKALRNYMGVS